MCVVHICTDPLLHIFFLSKKKSGIILRRVYKVGSYTPTETNRVFNDRSEFCAKVKLYVSKIGIQARYSIV